MKNNKLYIICMFLLLLLSSSCSEEPKRLPSTLPDVHGYISDIKRTANNGGAAKVVIMVKSIEGLEANHPVASLSIDENTLIESTTGENLKLEQLREGHEVQAWLEDGIEETMPVQGYANAMRVDY